MQVAPLLQGDDRQGSTTENQREQDGLGWVLTGGTGDVPFSSTCVCSPEVLLNAEDTQESQNESETKTQEDRTAESDSPAAGNGE